MGLNGSTALVASTNTPAILSTKTPVAFSSKRVGWLIQNLGTNPLFVRLGDGGSTTVFNFVLAAGTVNDNGTGGMYAQTEGLIYSGPISIDGTAPRYTLTEFYE